jgi:integrase
MTAQRKARQIEQPAEGAKYSIKRHAPSDLGSERAIALFEFREPHELSEDLRGDWPDTKVIGLYIHIGRNSASWRFRQNVQRKNARVVHYKTIGALGEMDYKDARKEALIFAGSVASGKAPVGKRAARRFDEAFETYMSHLKAKAERVGKPTRWHDNVQKLWKDYLKPQWGSWTLVEMSNDPRAVAAWYRKIAKDVPTTSAHCVRLIRACYRMEAGLDRSLPEALPTSGIKLAKIRTKGGEKAMPSDQFADWRKAWDKLEPIKRAFHLASLLTGCRPGEMAEIRAADFDPKLHTLTFRGVKTNENERVDRIVPTTPEIEWAIRMALEAPPATIVQRGLKGMRNGQKRVVKLLRHGEVAPPNEYGALIFPGCRQAPARSKLPSAGHALRHSFITLTATMDVPYLMSKILVGHATLEQGNAHGDYISKEVIAASAELKAAQAKISKHIFKLLGLKL